NHEAGERAESWNARVSERLQLFVLRRAQGRLAELEDTLRRSIHEFPNLPRFRCALAHLYAELGDRASLRQLLDEIAAIGLTRNYVDGEWLLPVGLLPDALRVINDTDLTAGLYDALAPREALYTQAPIEITFGSVARGLGVLATVLERFDEAEGHFVVA